MGDGHLDYNYGVKFVSGNRADLENLLNFIINYLGISRNRMLINERKSKGVSYALQLNYAVLGRFLYCLGAPKGNKTKQRFFIPRWIKQSKRNMKMFLQAILEDELTTIKIEKKNYSIKPKFKMAKCERLVWSLKNFLMQIKQGIESFGIDCSDISKPSKSKQSNTSEMYFHIMRNKRNIIKFEEKIGFFLNKEKKEKLTQCCKILRSTLRPDVDKEEILALRSKGLSIRQIANKIPHEKTTVHRVIKNSNI